jgi:hypothetical protein
MISILVNIMVWRLESRPSSWPDPTVAWVSPP